MSGSETTSTADDEGHHVIKFYRDVGDEVDSHFARALQPSKRPNLMEKSEGKIRTKSKKFTSYNYKTTTHTYILRTRMPDVLFVKVYIQ